MQDSLPCCDQTIREYAIGSATLSSQQSSSRTGALSSPVSPPNMIPSVGEMAVGDDWGDWVCPHIMGGLPPSIVDKEYPMTRVDGKAFAGIVGLVAEQ